MKLVSFLTSAVPSYGVVIDDGIIDLGRLYGPEAATLRQFLAIDGLSTLDRKIAGRQPDYRFEEVKLLPVIPDPGKIFCVGLNYRDHVEETGRAITEHPVLFARFTESQIAHGDALIRPVVSHEFDFEGELAVVIGKRGRHIKVEDALRHVAGYSCYNDGSVRDWQRHTSQFLPGKTFFGTGSFGPWLVTADEIPDPAGLTLETRLNGTPVQRTETSLMITPIPELIAYISTILPLAPGDVIVSGTPGGVGAKRNPPLWMRPGDKVEVEISGIGCLSNVVEDEADMQQAG